MCSKPRHLRPLRRALPFQPSEFAIRHVEWR
jgi:hypothetical protein